MYKSLKIVMAQSKGNEENGVNYLNELVILIKWSEMTYSSRYLIQSPKTKTQFKYEGILYYRSLKQSQCDLICFACRCVATRRGGGSGAAYGGGASF